MIFAAGESRRMGRDKALLDYRGATFLNHLLQLFLPRLDPVVVVLGHHAGDIHKSIAPPRGGGELIVTVNEHYQQGMLSSFQAGIRALPEDVTAAMFTLVDHPAVKESTLDRLLARFKWRGSQIVIPRYGETRGHPVVASRDILNEMLALPSGASPKDVMHAHREGTAYLDVDDRGVVQDIDNPAEYEEMKKLLWSLLRG